MGQDHFTHVPGHETEAQTCETGSLMVTRQRHNTTWNLHTASGMVKSVYAHSDYLSYLAHLIRKDSTIGLVRLRIPSGTTWHDLSIHRIQILNYPPHSK